MTFDQHLDQVIVQAVAAHLACGLHAPAIQVNNCTLVDQMSSLAAIGRPLLSHRADPTLDPTPDLPLLASLAGVHGK